MSPDYPMFALSEEHQAIRGAVRAVCDAKIAPYAAAVIEEVARADVSASLIPAVNKLGSLPVQISGGEEIKKKYLGALAAGEGGFSYCLSEPEAGSDAIAMKTRAVRDGDGWVLNGVKRWITNA